MSVLSMDGIGSDLGPAVPLEVASIDGPRLLRQVRGRRHGAVRARAPCSLTP